MITCAECTSTVSDGAKQCPSCGAPAKRMKAGQPRTMSIGAKIIIGLAVMTAIGIAVQGFSPAPKQSAADVVAEKAGDHRDTAALKAAQAIKDNLNDPTSARFDKVLVNADGTLVCMRYRARNGFGALILTQAVVRDGQAEKPANAWHKNCAGVDLYDVTEVSRYLR
jgi:ribosomal protein L40E